VFAERRPAIELDAGLSYRWTCISVSASPPSSLPLSSLSLFELQKYEDASRADRCVRRNSQHFHAEGLSLSESKESIWRGRGTRTGCCTKPASSGCEERESEGHRTGSSMINRMRKRTVIRGSCGERERNRSVHRVICDRGDRFLARYDARKNQCAARIKGAALVEEDVR